MEQWLSVINYPNYQVSNLGQIRNIKTGRILKPNSNAKGYCYVCLTNADAQKSISVHRLVAIHFLGDYSSTLTVNHKDFNKKNNKVSNLEWLTLKANIQHSAKVGKNRSLKVKDLTTGKIYSSLLQLANVLNVSKQAVQQGLAKKSKSYQQYKFVDKAA